MSHLDRTEIFRTENSGTDQDGVLHWSRVEVTEQWEAIDTAGKVCTRDATREAVIKSHRDSYAFLMQQTDKYDIDWSEHGGKPLPLAGVRKVIHNETTSTWTEYSPIEPVGEAS